MERLRTVASECQEIRERCHTSTGELSTIIDSLKVQASLQIDALDVLKVNRIAAVDRLLADELDRRSLRLPRVYPRPCRSRSMCTPSPS